MKLEVLQADVTKLEVDAIANAANTQLLHGGGVAAAIARAGGPAVDEESRRRADRARRGGGDHAGDMPARWVIHAATMELGGPTSAEIIAAATVDAGAADELGAVARAGRVRHGRRRFPLEEAARLMVGRAGTTRSLERWCSRSTATRPSGVRRRRGS